MTMNTSVPEPKAAYWLILVGGCFFILVLAVSAYWEADIRWLHFFQAWMYIATIVLSFRRSRWGYFIGISAAGLWEYINVFATTFLFNGLQKLSESIHSGHLERPDLIIAIPAWVSNFLVVVGCVWGYLRLREKGWIDAAKLLLTFALTTGFFALDMRKPEHTRQNIATSDAGPLDRDLLAELKKHRWDRQPAHWSD